MNMNQPSRPTTPEELDALFAKIFFKAVQGTWLSLSAAGYGHHHHSILQVRYHLVAADRPRLADAGKHGFRRDK